MKKLVIGVTVLIALVVGVFLTGARNTISTETIHRELIPKYPALKDNVYLKSNPRFVQLETEITICENQSVISYLSRPLKNSQAIDGDWQNIMVFDCGSRYYVGDISNTGSKLFGPFELN